MTRNVRLALSLWILVATGCAIPSAQPLTPAGPSALSPEAIRQQMLLLPGASERSAAEGGIEYPEGVLFAREAVLPLPGGVKVLDPLVRMIKGAPGEEWVFEVAADTGQGKEHDQRLAEQRIVLLRRYLERLTLNTETITFRIAEGQQAPLSVYMLPGEESSSESSKE